MTQKDIYKQEKCQIIRKYLDDNNVRHFGVMWNPNLNIYTVDLHESTVLSDEVYLWFEENKVQIERMM